MNIIIDTMGGIFYELFVGSGPKNNNNRAIVQNSNLEISEVSVASAHGAANPSRNVDTRNVQHATSAAPTPVDIASVDTGIHSESNVAEQHVPQVEKNTSAVTEEHTTKEDLSVEDIEYLSVKDIKYIKKELRKCVKKLKENETITRKVDSVIVYIQDKCNLNSTRTGDAIINRLMGTRDKNKARETLRGLIESLDACIIGNS
ncbi:MAG: hypothetical protein LBR91_02950 [Puniceicoccales bacterium]|nr:hypothetical protein [Puniceicoccales bacterium]